MEYRAIKPAHGWNRGGDPGRPRKGKGESSVVGMYSGILIFSFSVIAGFHEPALGETGLQ